MQPIVLIVSDDIPKISILRHVLQPLAHLVERHDVESADERVRVANACAAALERVDRVALADR